MKYSILGHGFIGQALADKLSKKNQVFRYLRDDVDVVFNFASPSSNVLFDHAIDYCVDETISSFLNVLRFCRQHHIKLIYPSSATIYNNIGTNYSNTKKALESIQQAYGGDILGLRIFAGYGVGEEHKGEYASIVYQFCKSMIQRKRPIIYGDGIQTRDFIYVNDIIDSIISNLDKTGIIDIGTGVNTSFNEVVFIINKELSTNIFPVYIPKPEVYINKTECKNPIGKSTSIKDGIKKILDHIKNIELKLKK